MVGFFLTLYKITCFDRTFKCKTFYLFPLGTLELQWCSNEWTISKILAAPRFSKSSQVRTFLLRTWMTTVRSRMLQWESDYLLFSVIFLKVRLRFSWSVLWFLVREQREIFCPYMDYLLTTQLLEVEEKSMVQKQLCHQIECNPFHREKTHGAPSQNFQDIPFSIFC